MNRALALFWYFFVVFGYSIVAGILFWGWSPTLYFTVVAAGLALYYAKLYYVDNLVPWEINYRTILYYLAHYVGFLITGVAVWLLFRALIIGVNPAFFRRLFESDELFTAVSRHTSVGIATFSVMLFTSLRPHSFLRSLYFTDKIALYRVVFIALTYTWLFISVHMAIFQITAIILATRPSHINVAWQRVQQLFNRTYMAWPSPDAKVKNNRDDIQVPELGRPSEAFLTTIEILWITVWKIQVPLILAMLTAATLIKVLLGA